MYHVRNAALVALIVMATHGCRPQPSERAVHSPSPTRCVQAGAGVDSAQAVLRAIRALEQPGETLIARQMQPVRDQGVELGLLVSLAVARPQNMVGGGGLVWVDLESGCAIVLRRYE